MTTVRNLASAEVLPGPLDYEAIVPPVHRWWVRRVGVLNLWLYYPRAKTFCTCSS